MNFSSNKTLKRGLKKMSNKKKQGSKKQESKWRPDLLNEIDDEKYVEIFGKRLGMDEPKTWKEFENDGLDSFLKLPKYGGNGNVEEGEGVGGGRRRGKEEKEKGVKEGRDKKNAIKFVTEEEYGEDDEEPKKKEVNMKEKKKKTNKSNLVDQEKKKPVPPLLKKKEVKKEVKKDVKTEKVVAAEPDEIEQLFQGLDKKSKKKSSKKREKDEDDDEEDVDEAEAVMQQLRELKKNKKPFVASKKKTPKTPDLDADDGFSGRSLKPGRKFTEEGYPIYTEDELKLNVDGAGETPDCPFDCQCCFVS